MTSKIDKMMIAAFLIGGYFLYFYIGENLQEISPSDAKKWITSTRNNISKQQKLKKMLIPRGKQQKNLHI